MITTDIILSVCTGIGLLAGILYLREKRHSSQMQTKLSTQQNHCTHLEAHNATLLKQNEHLKDAYEKHQQDVLHLNTQLREVETRLDVERASYHEKLEEQQHSKAQDEQKLLERFEHLSQKLLEQHSSKFRNLNQDSLQQTLTPFMADLKHFRQSFTESHKKESEERQHLKFELERLAQLNQQMSTDATALTQALKGDTKAQGYWGEVVLGRVLSASGLRDGHEYNSQASFKDKDGNTFRPDVIVHLPGKRCVIVDAKVSLTAYERYTQCDDPKEQKRHLDDHMRSLKQHIQGLSNKNYQQLEQLETLDYVLMFVAVEPAFMVAIEQDAELISWALKQNILLVSPTNLFVALRTIDNLWRVDRKNQNAEEIARRACNLYDKFRLLAEEIETLGNVLNKAQDSHGKITKRMHAGRDNIVTQIENFRALGVPVKKPLAQEYTERAQENHASAAELPNNTPDLKPAD